MLSLLLTTAWAGSPYAMRCDTRDHSIDSADDLFRSKLFGTGTVEKRDCGYINPLPAPLAVLQDIRAWHFHWANIDSSETFERIENTPPLALAALVRHEGWATKEGRMADLDVFFPVHSETTVEHRAPVPPWFADLAAHPNAEAAWSHWPAVLDDCRYLRGKGHLAVRIDDVVYTHEWNFQHIYPTGGCGG